MTDPLLAFYGDDFTGSTDALDALARAGVETVLYLSRPDDGDLADADGLDGVEDAQAVGLAGTSRSMSPAEMDEQLPPAFEALAGVGAPLVHYKICSTFDSSPTVGSIGRAIDLGRAVFEVDTVPLVPGAPPLGRHVAFGNMFAEYDGEIYRLDRHPVMRDHPITPMDEADLTEHLAEQTDRSIGLVDVLALRERPRTAYREAAADAGIVLLDGVTDADLHAAGRVVWAEHGTDDRGHAGAGGETTDTGGADSAATGDGGNGTTGRPSPSFVVGSSGVEYTLANAWEEAGLIDGTASFDPLEPVERTVVMSGSASGTTDTQIRRALEAGFEGIRIDTAALVRPGERDAEIERAVSAAVDRLAADRSVVLFTARGSDDPAIAATEAAAEEAGTAADLTRRVGGAQGEILREVHEVEPLSRLCVAGGDTCGHATPALGIDAVTARYPLAPGCPVCSVVAGAERVAGLEIALKSGQLGGPDYFIDILHGSGGA